MEKSLYYLAIPYHGSEEQKAYRHKLSLNATAEFLRQGVHVFSPVIYVNQIVEKLDFPSLEKRRTVTMAYLLNFLRVSKGLILIKAEGWQNSWGVHQELKFCQENQIPIYVMDPNQIYENLTEILSSPLKQKWVNQLLEAA